MAEWIIAGRSDDTTTSPEVGKIYEIRHSRKGTFTAQVLRIRNDWADVVILNGTARHVSKEIPHSMRGDEICVRDTLTYWIEIPDEEIDNGNPN